MYFQEDWLIKQIENMTRAIAVFVFNRKSVKYEIDDKLDLSAQDMLYHRLQLLIAEKEFCAAENLLYEEIDSGNLRYLQLALDFYQELNLFSDEELEANNFSRQELSEGITYVAKTFGIEDCLLMV